MIWERKVLMMIEKKRFLLSWQRQLDYFVHVDYYDFEWSRVLAWEALRNAIILTKEVVSSNQRATWWSAHSHSIISVAGTPLKRAPWPLSTKWGQRSTHSLLTYQENSDNHDILHSIHVWISTNNVGLLNRIADPTE